MKNQIIEAVLQEIAWCEQDQSKGEEYKEAFIAGLKQALFLIEKI